ncbi:MAG: hypothetical protein CMH44_05900 [Muricauda sp.]|nr:hypothetical protein [Allomuricauda sp.]
MAKKKKIFLWIKGAMVRWEVYYLPDQIIDLQKNFRSQARFENMRSMPVNLTYCMIIIERIWTSPRVTTLKSAHNGGMDFPQTSPLWVWSVFLLLSAQWQIPVLHATPFIFKIPRRKLILSMKIWILPRYGVQSSFTPSVAQ